MAANRNGNPLAPPIPGLRVSTTRWVTRSPHLPSMKGSLHLASMRGNQAWEAGLGSPSFSPTLGHTGSREELSPGPPPAETRPANQPSTLPLHVSAGLGKQSICPRGLCAAPQSVQAQGGVWTSTPPPPAGAGESLELKNTFRVKKHCTEPTIRVEVTDERIG